MGAQLTLSGAVDSFILNCQVKNLSLNNIRWYGVLLRTFSNFIATELPDLTLQEITPDHIRQYIRYPR